MLWDLAEGKRLYQLDAGDIIHALTFSPNRYWLCAATSTSIKVRGVLGVLRALCVLCWACCAALCVLCVCVAPTHPPHPPGFELSNLKMLVLDEADRLLDLGFKTTMTAILNEVCR